MRYIDIEIWPRRDHFKLFSSFDHPHFNLCANVDVTAFYPYVKQQGHSFTVSIVYLITRTANAIPEFRLRIRAGQVVEHEVVNAAFTILVDEDRFSFCSTAYVEDFPTFAARAAENIAAVRAHLDLEESPDRDDEIYMSAVPWVSFTGVVFPMHRHPGDSIPRFAWGKIFKEGDTLKMPLVVHAHHALMDGVHVGRFYEKLQDDLCRPEVALGGT